MLIQMLMYMWGSMCQYHKECLIQKFCCHESALPARNPALTKGISTYNQITYKPLIHHVSVVQCPVLRAPIDGAMTGFYYYQDVVEFTCDSGYNLVGSTSTTCQADGTWTAIAPTCTAVQCRMPRAPVNGAMTGSHFYRDDLHFTCDVGYYLEGASMITCLADGTWNDNVPVCSVVRCPILKAPADGGMTGSNSYGNTVQFTCDSGCWHVGAAAATCQADGRWSDSVPVCTAAGTVAMSKPAYQTSTGHDGPAELAVDGNTNGDYFAGFCTHTVDVPGETEPSWWVDLGQSYMVDRVVIFNRQDCCPERLNPFNIHIGDSDQVSTNPKCGDDHQIDVNQPSISVSCQGMRGRYVGVRLPGPNRILTLCEVQVFSDVPCPVLTAPVDGTMTGHSYFFYGSISFREYLPAGATRCDAYPEDVEFTCHQGYHLTGATRITCQADGTWSDSVPTCTVVQCPSLAAPINGMMTGSNLYRDVVNFACDTGYDLVGPPSATCLASGAWSDIVPNCSAVRCPLLEAPAHGTMTGNNSYQDVAEFTCDVGYSRVGVGSATCQADARWSDIAPVCTVVECPVLTPPPNGAMEGSSNSFEDVVHFSCYPGYNLVGATNTTCQSDGTWGDNTPTCEIVQCPLPTAPEHGERTGSNLYRDVLHFTCHTGYYIDGSRDIVCLASGTWSDNVPTCTVVQCPQLTPPLHGGMTGFDSYQDVKHFTCDTGYNLVGSEEMTCQADGTWSGSFPTCTIAQCPELRPPADGTMQGCNSYQGVARFTCNPGYGLVGEASVTCQADGTWSSSAPVCSALPCPSPEVPEHGTMTGYIAYKEAVRFFCDTGYNLVGATSILCRVDGTWSGTVPTCTLVHCPVLTSPSDGTMTGGNSYQEVLQFSCNSGYYLVGDTAITCQADGTWTGSAPTCAAVECPALTTPDDGAMTGTNFYPAVVHFACNDGYVLVGSHTLTCQADATWSGTAPTCTLVQCPAMVAPANGAVSGSNYYGDEAQFSCSSGYEIFGSSTISCLEDGQWSMSAPTCTDGPCPNLLPPMNGGMTGENSHGSAVTFTCNSGYEIQGAHAVTCKLDSTWTDNPPTCKVLHCPTLTSPANGGMVGFTNYRAVVTFSCDPGYDLVGETSVTCRGDGTWSGSVPSCSAIHCPSMTALANGYFTGSNAYRSVVTFHCLPGYELVGDESLTCQADRTWSGPLPTCDVVKCPAQAAPTNGAKLGGNLYNEVVTFLCVTGYHLVGSSSARCQEDGSWTAPTPTCPDVDECSSSNGGCEQICTNTDGSFHCSCHVGYSLSINSFSCIDIDECASANGGCSHTCSNRIGSYQCSCNNGYALNSDNLGCDDVDECAIANGRCGHICTNSDGSYQCSCNTGYALNSDEHTCDDINECLPANMRCDQGCINTDGSFFCQCGFGFLLNSDGLSCDGKNR
ncbi:sushi, von Willebrand factor type A, EGF and pentraxin domain-containing protein 1-like [Branchiostoma floridae x Branchiostoma belcheri]